MAHVTRGYNYQISGDKCSCIIIISISLWKKNVHHSQKSMIFLNQNMTPECVHLAISCKLFLSTTVLDQKMEKKEESAILYHKHPAKVQKQKQKNTRSRSRSSPLFLLQSKENTRQKKEDKQKIKYKSNTKIRVHCYKKRITTTLFASNNSIIRTTSSFEYIRIIHFCTNNSINYSYVWYWYHTVGHVQSPYVLICHDNRHKKCSCKKMTGNDHERRWRPNPNPNPEKHRKDNKYK